MVPETSFETKAPSPLRDDRCPCVLPTQSKESPDCTSKMSNLQALLRGEGTRLKHHLLKI